ncbi:hypothetical protein [Arthrobacter ginkgonis]|uniref:hypothetical protein n=1 Tax=Arthrobacter ginkgonis TaxID=1630594 RepID=UPI0031F14FEA
MDGGDADAKPDVDAGRGQLVQRIAVGLVGELSEQGAALVDQSDLASTSAVSTLTVAWFLKMVRWGRAMSSAGSRQPATWYNNGWNWL